ncbi:Receptor-like protein kinase [Picochlorum sp. SENEW3]|nr:Receptor-like protein kinase [Picochlorum sp. SENEW3]
MGFFCTYRIFVLYSCVFGCIVALLGQAVVANEVVEVNSSVDGILGPGESEVYRVGNGDAGIGDAGLNVTVTAQMCSPDGVCVYRDESTGYEAALSLRCGSASVGVGEYITSSYVGGTQTLLLTPQTPNVVDVVVNCVVTSETFNAGSIKYTLSVNALGGLPRIVEEDGALLNALYEICCAEEGSCEYWNAVNLRAEEVSATRVARQGVAAAPVPAPEDIAPEAIVPEPSSDAEAVVPQASAPEAVVPQATGDTLDDIAPAPQPGTENTTSGPFTDFCSLGGNLCTSDGNIETLYLKSFGLQCEFSKVVAIVSNMTQMQRLVLAENKGLFASAVLSMDEIPDVKEGRVVTDVQLDNTSITASSVEVADEFGLNMLCRLAQRGLLSLSVVDTPIGGEIGPCMFANSSLQVLSAGRSNFIGITDQITESNSLRSLRVEEAALQGTLPKLPSTLAELQVSDNMLEGSLPAPTDGMVGYDVSGNRFTGTIPDEFVDHPTLRIVSLSGNELEGIPTAWASTTSRPENSPPLKLIYLSDNPLKTAFPAGLGLYPNLTGLFISDADLEGPLPELTEGAFPALVRLHVDSNDISGTVPDSWEGTNLFSRETTSMDVRFGNFSTNSMSGNLPEWLGGTILNAEYNFSGNNFSNGCEEQFKALDACNGAPSPASSASTPPPSDAPAPAPDSSSKGDESDDGGLSGGAIAAIVIVVIIIVAIGGFFLFKKYKRSKMEGSFTRFDDSGVQMTANQAYNPTLDP